MPLTNTVMFTAHGNETLNDTENRVHMVQVSYKIVHRKSRVFRREPYSVRSGNFVQVRLIYKIKLT